MNTTVASGNKAALSTKGMNIALWIVQVILAALFGMAGIMKLTMPMATLATKIPWTADVPVLLVRFIGASELSAALGLILPSLLRIRPRLTVLAGLGLVVVMILAIVFHLMRGEASVIWMNLVFMAMAAFVAWGRSRKAVIAPRD